MFEQPVSEKQCGVCMECKSTMDFRFRTSSMTYNGTCRKCENAMKAAKRPVKPKKPPRWPPCDVAVIREFFPEGGAAACRDRLPNHGEPAIRAKAHSLGLKYIGPRQQGSRPLDSSATPLPAPHDYAPEDLAWMATRLPVFVGGFGAARIGG